VEILTPVLLGAVLGFLIGLTGVGGGALVAPVLFVVLGLSYQEAVALSLIYSSFTKIVGAAQHLRQGTVVGNVTLLYGLTGVPGAIFGSRMVYAATPAVQAAFPFVLGGVLILVSALLAMETRVSQLAARAKPFSRKRLTWPAVVTVTAIQLGVGILMGLTSVGSGSLVILSMLWLFEMPAKLIVGSSLVIALIMILPAAATHFVAAGVGWATLTPMLAGSAGGAVLGSRTVFLMRERDLKLAIAALVMLGGIATIVKAW
jgi:uncharacterized protein